MPGSLVACTWALLKSSSSSRVLTTSLLLLPPPLLPTFTQRLPTLLPRLLPLLPLHLLTNLGLSNIKISSISKLRTRIPPLTRNRQR
ncbi:hypothetical protein GGF41_003743 [Coemansia sp. RSA 2531]|nr:hypothetical protein GGF41_003743 [Coemansia sp. RSA 2531]